MVSARRQSTVFPRPATRAGLLARLATRAGLLACLATRAGLLACLVALAACTPGTTSEGRVSAPSDAPTIHVTPPIAPPTTPTPSELRTFAPGPTFDFTNQQGSGTFQVVSYSWQKTRTGDKSAAPKNVYLVLDVLVTNKQGVVLVNPAYLTATGADKAVYAPAFGTDGNEPVLVNKELRTPAESYRGFLSFDLPQQDVTLTLVDEVGKQVGQAKIPKA